MKYKTLFWTVLILLSGLSVYQYFQFELLKLQKDILKSDISKLKSDTDVFIDCIKEVEFKKSIFINTLSNHIYSDLPNFNRDTLEVNNYHIIFWNDSLVDIISK